MEPIQAKTVAAVTGSSLTALTMTPFDVVKTRLQTQPTASSSFTAGPASSSQSTSGPSRLRSKGECCQPANVPCVRRMTTMAAARQNVVCFWESGILRTEPVNGFFDAFRHIWRVEGIRGLWKGAGTTLLMGVPSAASYMLLYDYLMNTVFQQVSTTQGTILVPLISGMSARATISSIISPIELFRTNLQATPADPGRPNTIRGTMRVIRELAQQRGARVLWSGLGPTLWRDVPFSGLYWAGFETSKRWISQQVGQKDKTWIAFASGATSGMMSAILTHPFDVMKTRRQALIMATTTRDAPLGSWGLASQIIRTEGYKALFAGALPRIAKIAPACGIMIGSFEGIGRLLAKK